MTDNSQHNRIVAMAKEQGYQNALKDVTTALKPTTLPLEALEIISRLCDESIKRFEEVRK